MPPTMKAPAPPAPTQAAPKQSRFTFGAIAEAAGHRVVLYGPGGIGKTTLGAMLPGKTAVIDFDESLPRLKDSLENRKLVDNIVPVNGIATWADCREALQADIWGGINNIVLDSITRGEELCIAHTLATVKHEKGHLVSRIEDYGYGKGYQFVFDTFLPLLGDLDRHCRAGRNVILIAHDCVTTVPNPAGEDWIRYEPRLQGPQSGKAAIRLRVKEWADHVLFLGYDVIAKDGKGQGSGTRTLYPAELPHCMAKSRTCQEQIPITDGANPWEKILK